MRFRDFLHSFYRIDLRFALARPKANAKRIVRGSVKPEWGLRVGFMPNFIHRLLAANTLIEPVGTVEDNTLDTAHILVGVSHARGDDEEHGLVDADGLGVEMIVSLRSGAIVPKINLEVR